MPRDLPIGNGSLLVNFDSAYSLRDLYFPNVGRDNNTVGHPCRVGIWANGWFSWLHHAGWERRLCYEPDTLVTDVVLHNPSMGLSIACHDAVSHHMTVLLRSFEVTNHWDVEREIRLFFCQDLHIAETADGDTAYYEPVNDFLIHYKGRHYFLINGRSADGRGIFQYATGNKEFGPSEGTWLDAEDGELGMNPIAQGSVDSVISLRQSVLPHASTAFVFWIAAERGYFDVKELNGSVLRAGVVGLLEATRKHWRSWVQRSTAEYGDLPESLQEFYRRSLLLGREPA